MGVGWNWLSVVSRQVSVLAVLNLLVLLPESYLISKLYLKEIGCEDGSWIELAQVRV